MAYPIIRGKTKLPEYRVWFAMKRRCEGKNSTGYYKYGARGIKVFPEWSESFESWFAYMGPRPSPKHSIDRFPDTNGDYRPGNVRWATAKQQSRNRRSNLLLTFNGKTQCVIEWVEEIGLTFGVLHNRLEMGWTVERALTQPRGLNNTERRLNAQGRSSASE